MDQSEAPILDGLVDYRKSNRYGFTPPGHRQGRGTDDRVLDVLGHEPFRDDILASGGLDDRRTSNKYLKRAEDLMAEAVGAEMAFFSTCGSSLSVKAAMMAVAGCGSTRGSGGSLLVGRDSHKSIVAGLIFSGVQPRWITPRWDADRHFSHPPSPEQVNEAWEKHPDAAGALVVSPSPYGTCTDLEAIAKVCHDRGKPLIVDEAWGAHLPFHEDLPTWAMDAGADVCVVSVHKMGAGFEQGSVFHRAGRSHRQGPAVGLRGPADDHEPERDGVRGDRRLAAADGPARARIARRRTGIGARAAQRHRADPRRGSAGR